jgi:hypothetical protein
MQIVINSPRLLHPQTQWIRLFSYTTRRFSRCSIQPPATRVEVHITHCKTSCSSVCQRASSPCLRVCGAKTTQWHTDPIILLLHNEYKLTHKTAQQGGRGEKTTGGRGWFVAWLSVFILQTICRFHSFTISSQCSGNPSNQSSFAVFCLLQELPTGKFKNYGACNSVTFSSRCFCI